MTLGQTPPSIIFDRDIRPIFARRCNNCHLGETVKSGFSLASRDDALRGGDSGEAAIVPGKPDESRLYKLVAGLDPDATMPPKGGPLTREQIDLIRKWIEQGATWGADHHAADGNAPRSWHWSYQPVIRPEPPATTNTTWARSPIDSFILARLEREGLAPEAEADRTTLIRRLSLDLIGLPPTPEEVDAFLADESPSAYERVADRLLASPRFGEHWARFWLDLARYADSHGYEKDGLRVMWPYRDWAIDAFNRDMPFDQFTIEQLAGDMLPSPTRAQLVATGFHRNTQINEEGGTDPEEFRIDAVIDRVNTTASVWLGTTLACAQCHDHKYDPISQREYFEMLAFFNQDAEDAEVINATATEKRAGGPMVPVPAWGRYDEFDAALKHHDTARQAFKPFATSLVSHNINNIHAALGPTKTLIDAQSRVKSMTLASALVMGRAPTPRQSHIFIRGSFLSPGDAVEPRVPAALATAAPPGPPAPPESPDRLGLAKWITSPSNPLTARVHVNRLWSRLFGRGLVETEEDFGVQGEAPADPDHAALLDYLASEFVRLGWSQKQLIRAIVTSATYRQSSRAASEKLESDPYNKLLSRGSRHRVDAETVRDIALAASGLLSTRMYGPSVFPPQPPGIWTQIYSGDQWRESEGEDRYRRGLYTFARRTSPYPTFGSFDAPSREMTCIRRPRTNTPLQALTTLNDPQFIEAAGALARRMMEWDQPNRNITTQLARGFRLATARTPDADELNTLVKLHESSLARFRSDPAAAAALITSARAGSHDIDTASLAAFIVAANVLLNLDETITRE